MSEKSLRKRTNFVKTAVLFCIAFLLMAGCEKTDQPAQRTSPETTANLPLETAAPLPPSKENIPVREIPVDFPFYPDTYTLTLVPPYGETGEYHLKLCNENGELLQSLSCGSLTEPVEFSCDRLYYSSAQDLEIFSSVSSTGLLFRFDQKEKRFSETALEIPRYTEIRDCNFLVQEENELYQKRSICQINDSRGQVEELRSWNLQKDTGLLCIRDSLEEQSLFEGIAELDENTVPVNNAYYEYLFWDGLPLLWDCSKATSLSTWIGWEKPEDDESRENSGFEYVQNNVFGDEGHAEEYENRLALLTDYGFEDETPFYRYYDRYHNLLLELYLTEDCQKGCGIAYQYLFNSEREQITRMYGFTIGTIWEQEWNYDAFSLKSIDKDDDASSVNAYEEILEYTKDGRPAYFKSQGLADLYGNGEELTKILEISFLYRDDGSLFCREYWHNSGIFGTTLCSVHSMYDQNERVVFESGYITHGHCEYYYIYEDESPKPAYCLLLDYNGGYAIPALMRCR